MEPASLRRLLQDVGLTIHYTLTAPPGTVAAGAGALVRQLRQRALACQRRGRVDAVHPLGEDADALRWAREWLFFPVPGQPQRHHQAEVLPVAGCLFPVGVGEDCEPLWLGLCRYPLTVRVAGELRRTKLRGWRLQSCCKTQSASLHGWEHFRRCHLAVIDLLESARRLGCAVTISDEGDYWPGRDEAALRRNVDEMNGLVAATAGALKDAAEDGTGSGAIQSPIFAHPQFERLEAEGAARGFSARLRKALR